MQVIPVGATPTGMDLIWLKALKICATKRTTNHVSLVRVVLSSGSTASCLRHSCLTCVCPNSALPSWSLSTLVFIELCTNINRVFVPALVSVRPLALHRATVGRRCSGLHNEGNPTPQEKYMQYMQVLLTDIAVVHSFLGELDPGFVVCFDYNRIGDANQSASVANFVAPNADVAKVLDNSFVALAEPHAKTTESLLYEGGDVIASRLQRKFDAFESQLCSGTRQE